MFHRPIPGQAGNFLQKPQGLILNAEQEEPPVVSRRRLDFGEQVFRCTQLDLTVVTPEFLKEADGKLDFVRDDFLARRASAGHDPATLAFLDSIAQVKEQVRATGHAFSA